MRSPFIPEVPRDAFGRKPRSYDDLRRLAARHASDELAGLTLINHATQLAITLAPDALAAATRPGASASLLRAIAELPSLLSGALYVRTAADRQRRPEVRRLQLLAAGAEISGRPVELLFVVRENFNGQCFLDRVIERDLTSRRRQDGGDVPPNSMAQDNASSASTPQLQADDPDVDRPDTIARYPDGSTILDSAGKPTQKPPFADLSLAVTRAKEMANAPYPEKLRTMINWLKQGGPMDFQRIPGHKPDSRYQDFSNYVFGAVTRAAGVSPSISFPGGVAYNAIAGRWRPGFLGTPVENIKMWKQVGRIMSTANLIIPKGVTGSERYKAAPRIKETTHEPFADDPRRAEL